MDPLLRDIRHALTMLMTGAPDEEPRRVTYPELLALVRRAANAFAALAGPRPGIAYMLPSLIETHATLWGAETAGYAVPINFLLQPEPIAELLKASGARVLVVLGPHPVLDIWRKALALRELVPGLTLVRVAPPARRPSPASSSSTPHSPRSRMTASSSANPAATTRSPPTSTPAARPARRDWSGTRIAGSLRRRSAARCSATCARPTR